MSLIAHFSPRPSRKNRAARFDARPAADARQPPVSPSALMMLAGGGLIAASAAGWLLGAGGDNPPSRPARYAALGAALLAGSVLADSALEHYRGNYRRPAMGIAPLAAGATLATALATAISRRALTLKSAIFGASFTTGLFGLGFHLKNILERPGGLSFNNLFYRAPFGAPGALALAGASGLCAVAAENAAWRASEGTIEEDTGRILGLVTAGGMFGLTAEVGLLHFRGAFHNPLMYAPVAAVPLTGAAILAASVEPTGTRHATARRLLGATTALGLVGPLVHAYGVSRNMGGFGNWTQTLFQGPPIAAPPSLAGMALTGFAALDLLKRSAREHRHD
ncbi:hypothetical protein [Consotaella salsifontis]|uniref:Uncharacterized protein n=1 Tax=Consotaella salsifontis TaxID=1365950 RepID=A0A1T4TFC8_9HYPH|nr:hypothetical protein [Consotaella salsifontis]SKA39183.1 hypothetical protein SAMN05428963_1295 [Consotaella salsifontis]